ncbi:MAG: DNA-formamidopyrimidine glycosylase family protein [Armatimonadota bacterium]|nr:DNA-formamidopyrimidine glycosylase family protein [Armatimonadota bacterium]MDR7427960.1 DNA-formamidopyrimidine glycosylase family protein [Armatimonadota bacterium]MDR7464143.1 DNA-formamidopyrimidine glycosylase family protein [Armatimonadota bacterium]MDR7470434.1 DNA-formamidopyrimidine glycosylase family protein [Armatimonadota bacterium]MDR7473516.1 DNA-formamidopyrimidine glycosylase family protein [Armatimonadota bacterium]
MPELPEVEVLARHLRPHLLGQTIRRVQVLSPATVRSPRADRFARLIRGRTVRGVSRKGKYLLIALDGAMFLAVHLCMTGDLVVVPRSRPLHPHTRVVLGLDGADLRFLDQRRFGSMALLPGRALPAFPTLKRLGAEPLGVAFTLERFRALLRPRRGGLKALLLRQEVVAGIGNLYADEILFQARLHPGRRVESLRLGEVRRLYRAVRHVLRRAVLGLARAGDPGGVLLPVRQEGAACPRCDGRLAGLRLAGRTTVFCPSCQG